MTKIALPLFALAATGVAADSVKLTVPDAPPAGTLTLDGSFQGYSMEVASFADIAGNLTYGDNLTYS